VLYLQINDIVYQIFYRCADIAVGMDNVQKRQGFFGFAAWFFCGYFEI
jgi:hypothetical protein